MSARLLSGAKFSSRHSTYIHGSDALLRKLRDHVSVKKVMLGEIRPSSGGRRAKTGAAKVRRVDGHFIEISYRGPDAVQIFRVVSSDPDAIRRIVEEDC